MLIEQERKLLPCLTQFAPGCHYLETLSPRSACCDEGAWQVGVRDPCPASLCRSGTWILAHPSPAGPSLHGSGSGQEARQRLHCDSILRGPAVAVSKVLHLEVVTSSGPGLLARWQPKVREVGSGSREGERRGLCSGGHHAQTGGGRIWRTAHGPLTAHGPPALLWTCVCALVKASAATCALDPFCPWLRDIAPALLPFSSCIGRLPSVLTPFSLYG